MNPFITCIAVYYLYISLQSRSPLSIARMISSAVARLVATGILYVSHSRITSFTSGSCGFGFDGSRRKISASIPFWAIWDPSCCFPPSGPASYLCTFRFVTSSIRRPVVPVAYSSFLLRIPRYAMQKFCIRVFFESCAMSPIFIFLTPYLYFFCCSPTFNTSPMPINILTRDDIP